MKTEPNMITVGIDNGLSGGMVALSPHGLLIRGMAMPVIEIAGERVPNIRAVLAWFGQFVSQIPITVAIEECPHHAASATAMRSMGMSYGSLLAAMGSCLSVRRVVAVKSGNSMESWQRKMLGVGTGRAAPTDTKAAALAKARLLWPDQSWVCNGFGLELAAGSNESRRRSPHNGMIDAALIAEFSRRNYVEN